MTTHSICSKIKEILANPEAFAAAAAAAAPAADAAPAAEAKEEEQKEEAGKHAATHFSFQYTQMLVSEESDDDMGFGLFD